MKKKKEVYEVYPLSVAVANYNEESRCDAMEEYLNGDAHLTFLIAGGMTDHCRDSIKNLKAGKITPRLDICCCNETFRNILLGTTQVRYSGYDLPLGDVGDPDPDHLGPVDQSLSKDEYVELAMLKGEELGDRLEGIYGCEAETYVQTHSDDDKVQRQYYEAVVERFRAAAVFAKSIGSDSAKVWLDALRLLMPRISLQHDDPNIKNGLNLVAEDVEKAYERAEEAQGMLWVDLQFAELKPSKSAKIAKKPAKRAKKH